MLALSLTIFLSFLCICQDSSACKWTNPSYIGLNFLPKGGENTGLELASVSSGSRGSLLSPEVSGSAVLFTSLPGSFSLANSDWPPEPPSLAERSFSCYIIQWKSRKFGFAQVRLPLPTAVSVVRRMCSSYQNLSHVSSVELVQTGNSSLQPLIVCQWKGHCLKIHWGTGLCAHRDRRLERKVEEMMATILTAMLAEDEGKIDFTFPRKTSWF